MKLRSLIIKPFVLFRSHFPIRTYTCIFGVFPFRLSCKFQVKIYEKVLSRNGNRVYKGKWQLVTSKLQLNKWIYMDLFVLNIIFSCRKMVEISVDLMIKLQQFPFLPYRWSKNTLRRNGNNYLTCNSQLRRNGNKPYFQCSRHIPFRDLRILSEKGRFIVLTK